jgi:TP901 family phage tail tape measure protein
MSEFLAEARVRISPDTSQFRAELLAQLQAATKGVSATIPVSVATAGAEQARQVQQELADLAAKQQAAVTKAAASATSASRQLQTAQTAAARASERLALAQQEVTAAATPLAAAQIRLTRTNAALTAAQRAHDAALAAGNAALIQATAETLALARARQAEAASALQAARAEAAHASQLRFATRGAAATGLSLLGVRGATLAANSAFLAGAAAIAAFAKSVGLAAGLERQLNIFRVTAGATADEMARAAAEARRLGSDITLPAVSTADAAQAMTELAKAGLSVQDSIEGARGVLQLATAAGIDNAQATEFVANALNAFGLAGNQASRVADLFAGASIEAQGSIVDMAVAFQQAAAVGRQVGLSLEDVATFITLFARAGLRGSDAGTSLRTALLRLVNPTEKAAKIIRDLGIQIRDAQGNVRPDVFAQFGRATAGLSPAARDAALAIVFGQDAIRGAAIAAREGVRGFDETQKAISRAGSAAELAGAATDGFSGKVEALKNNLGALGSTIGTAALPALEGLLTVLNGVVSGINIGLSAFGKFTRAVNDAIPALRKLDEAVGFRDREVTIEIAPVETGESLASATADASSRLREGLQAAAAAPSGARGLSPKQILTRITGFEAQQVRAQIRGQTDELLASLRAEQDFLEQQLQRGVVRRRPGLQRRLEEKLLGVVREIERIQDEASSERERAARDAENRRKEAEDRFFSALGLREQRLQNRVLEAEATATLRDDIRANVALRNFYRASIEQIKETIRAGLRRQQAIADARANIIRTNQTIRQLREEQRRQFDEEREDALRLNVEFAEITENRRKEIAARERLIAFLQEEQRKVRRGSNEWRKLRNEIARERKEIERLRGEAKDRRRSFRELTFEFLQAQQGFAATLLSNLIPIGAAAGTVGGRGAGAAERPLLPAAARPQAAVEREAAVARARDGGPTRTQASVEIDVLRQILQVLREIRSGRSHPEARYQRAEVRASGELFAV